LDAPCDLAGSLSGAKIEVGPGRADNRRPGILRDHEASERRLAESARLRHIGFDKEWRPVAMQGLVDRN
jgi:hypothetical protein